MRKQIFLWIMAVCLLCSMVPAATAVSEEIAGGSCGDNLTWTLDDRGVLTVSGTGPMMNASGAAYPWHSYKDIITSVVIENGVTTVGESAFECYQNLTSVVIPDSVVAIRGSAFYYCHNLESLVLGDQLQTIGTQAFASCYKLQDVHIPGNVFSIKKDAFEYCTGLTGFSVDPENTSFSNDDAGVLFDREKTTLIQAPGAISGSYSVPDSVITINSNAFGNCDQLLHVSMGEQVRTIGERSFDGCDGLETVFISASVTEIGDHAFNDCISLLRFTVDSANTCYSADASGVLMDKSQTTLIQAPGAISGIYSVPDTVTTIGTWSFYNCDELTGIEGGSRLTSIGWGAFEYCDKLYRVTLPDSLTYMDYYVFAYCDNLTSVQLGTGLTEIINYAFYGCDNLTDITLPESIRDIRYAAFRGCASLEEVVIPCNVTMIEEWAFSHCDCLESVYFRGNAPEICDTSFRNTETTGYYPKGNGTWTNAVLRDYGGSITWVPYSSAVEIASGWSGNTQWILTDDGVLTVYGSGNMRNYEYQETRPWEAYAARITSVVIEPGVTAIGECAFRGLSNLESVTMPETGLIRIGEAACYGCTSLKQIDIPDSVYTVPDYAFKNCTSLSDVRLSKRLIKIGQGAFENCTALDYIFIPGDTEIIGSWSFKGCTSLAEADMQWADATGIREGAFKNCSALKEIILPGNIQVLGDSCFYGIGATEFTVPATVLEVQPWCFARAYSLETIIFEGDAPTIGEGAFNKITLRACYPEGNASWTADVMQNYGGSVTWETDGNH